METDQTRSVRQDESIPLESLRLSAVRSARGLEPGLERNFPPFVAPWKPGQRRCSDPPSPSESHIRTVRRTERESSGDSYAAHGSQEE